MPVGINERQISLVAAKLRYSERPALRQKRSLRMSTILVFAQLKVGCEADCYRLPVPAPDVGVRTHLSCETCAALSFPTVLSLGVQAGDPWVVHNGSTHSRNRAGAKASSQNGKRAICFVGGTIEKPRIKNLETYLQRCVTSLLPGRRGFALRCNGGDNGGRQAARQCAG
jgi:hypothetical protein